MPQTKRTAQRKRRSKVVLTLEAAGLSLSLVSSASAAIGGMNGASSGPVSKPLYEEELCDVSLATFHVFDRENAGTQGGAHDWPWGPAVAAVAVVAVAVVPVGSVCTIITHRRCLATQSIRRLGRSARRTNINPTAPRASQCFTESGASSSAALDARRARRGQPLPVRGRLEKRQQPSYLFGYVRAGVAW